MKKYIFFVFILLLTFSGCTRKEEISISTNGMTYLLSYSHSDRERFENALVATYANGDVQEVACHNSMSLENAIQIDEEYRFFSKQMDQHLKVNDGQIQLFQTLSDDLKGSYCGVFSTCILDSALISIHNIGASEKGYLTRLNVEDTESNTSKSYDFYEKILCSATGIGDQLLISYIDLRTEKPDDYSIGQSGIMVFDLKSEKVLSEFLIPTQFRAEPGLNLAPTEDGVYLYTNQLNLLRSDLGFFKERKLVKTLFFDSFISQIYPMPSSVLVFFEDGQFHIYDKEATLIKKGALVISSKQWVRKSHLINDILYVALMSEEPFIQIHSMDVTNGVKLSETLIPYPKTFEWRMENFEFLVGALF